MSDFPFQLPPPLKGYKEFNKSEKRSSGVSDTRRKPNTKRTKVENNDNFIQELDIANGAYDTRKTSAVYLETGQNLVIHNVLASGRLHHDGKMPKLDLDYVANIFQDTYFNRVEFSATRINISYRSTMYAVSVFENGRIQSTGGADPLMTEYVLKKTAKRLASRLPNLSYQKCVFKNFEIQNILAVLDLGRLISLKVLIVTVPGGADYEPETFPAARFRIPVESSFDEDVSQNLLQKTEFKREQLNEIDTRSKAEKLRESSKINKEEKQEHVTINVFGTGKVTFTGARSVHSISYAWGTLWPYVQKVMGTHQ